MGQDIQGTEAAGEGGGGMNVGDLVVLKSDWEEKNPMTVVERFPGNVVMCAWWETKEDGSRVMRQEELPLCAVMEVS